MVKGGAWEWCSADLARGCGRKSEKRGEEVYATVNVNVRRAYGSEEPPKVSKLGRFHEFGSRACITSGVDGGGNALNGLRGWLFFDIGMSSSSILSLTLLLHVVVPPKTWEE
ncbi:hypothetical protein VNO80_09434 [Phaseolus coccineus]|uniref:Uncharacterized protein n=1 Tax=Phaseolus coccineus TaxID=3886 RepID=A0AAN9N6M8_PHACN